MRMKMEEYLRIVTEQIRCAGAREMVSGELRDHILDQAEAYEAEGMFEEEALEKAVQDMGDPVETGVSLDRIHRPQLSVGILILVGIISLGSIALHAALGIYAREAPAVSGYLHRHVLYIVLGYILMLVIYRLDYSVLSRFAKPMAVIFLAVLLIGKRFFGMWINGAMLYIRMGSVALFLPTLLILYVPLFGAILYSYRGEGCKGMGRIFLWALIPTWFAFQLPAFSQGVILWGSFVTMTAVAVYKGWYRIPRKAGLAFLGLLFAAPPLMFLGAGILGRLATYQIARIQAFLTNSPDNNYLAIRMRELLENSTLVGVNAGNVAEIAKLPGFNSDYIFVSLITTYGLLAGVLAAALMFFLIIKVFRISFGQKNQLGMILGCGCGIVYLLQTVLCLGMNLGLLPSTAVILPFFSSGGTGIIVAYILLGLVLSVYRYKNILPEKAEKNAVRRVS